MSSNAHCPRIPFDTVHGKTPDAPNWRFGSPQTAQKPIAIQAAEKPGLPEAGPLAPESPRFAGKGAFRKLATQGCW